MGNGAGKSNRKTIDAQRWHREDLACKEQKMQFRSHPGIRIVLCEKKHDC